MLKEKILKEHNFVENEKDVLNSVNTPSFMASLNTPFEALDSTTATTNTTATTLPRSLSLFGCFSSTNKRVSETGNDEESCVDPRYKRMMKNRESAARSRARRQAYTSELEREIAELMEDNAKLRKRQVELLLSAPPIGIPKKNNHNRSLTAPF